MKHIAYTRVSTAKQEEGPKAQLAAISRWASSNNVKISDIYSEVMSGGAKLEKRECLLDAIDALSPGDVLLAHKRDRLSRSVMTTAMIERMVRRKGATIVVCEGPTNDDTPEGQLMRTMVDAFAEYERAVIRARTRAALASKRARGEATGGNPRYGWKKVGKDLVQDEQEQENLARMLELRGEGLSYQAITDKLEEEGLRPRGDKWHLTSVVRAIKQAQA
jgi:site-specific DNA recombinase